MLADLATRITAMERPQLRGGGAPALPVSPALAPLLPGGLRRGSTVAVTGSVSLVLATVGEASAAGAWCALVGMPTISAEAAHDFGIVLERFPLVPSPGRSWAEVVGALLDAVDIVVAQVPARLADGDIRRLAARVRTRDAVFVPFAPDRHQWPHAEVRLEIEPGCWAGIGEGSGRLCRREVTVTAAGRAQRARARSATLWLPAADGGVQSSVALTPAPVVLMLAGR
ncbi:MAG TPA: hypothetical protein VMH41_11130 [Mycobacteriales bacterium]|nr:hypothetical protein [Mycobacteriales bacterium]